MAWERRQRGDWYYTRSRRVDGRIVREYVGAGIVGELAAEADLLARQDREDHRQLLKQEQERLRLLDGLLAAAEGLSRGQAAAALRAAGYHQHHRGEWRRKRSFREEQLDG